MGALLIDTRAPKEFEQGCIPGSINLPLTMNYAMWVGTLFPPSTKFFIIADKGKEGESIIRLSRIGYDQIVGVLDGGIEGYKASGKPLETVKHIAPADLTPDMMIFDVRNTPEVQNGHIYNAIHVPLLEVQRLAELGKLHEKFPKDKTFHVVCRSGARSMIACSILKNAGYNLQVNVDGGYVAVRAENKHLKFIE